MMLSRFWTILLVAAMVAGCGPGTSAILGGIVASSDDDDDPGKARRPPPEEPPSGVADLSFGLSGHVTRSDTGGGGGNDHGYAIAVDDLGRILVSGDTQGASGPEMAVWRFHADGTADMTFGGQGFVTHDGAAGGTGPDYGDGGIGVDGSRRIVVAGRSWGPGGDADATVWRYLDSGALDTTFAGAGFVAFYNIVGSDASDEVGDLVLLPGDRILIAGHSRPGTSRSDIFLIRLEPDGDLDYLFGAAGVVVHGDLMGVNETDLGLGLAIDREGRILLSGSTQDLGYHLAVWRFTEDGGLDPAFGLGGYVYHDLRIFGIESPYGESITATPDGDLLVTGRATTPLSTGYDMMLWRLDGEGSLDLSFLGRGYLAHDGAAGGAATDEGNDITVDAAGGVLIAGSSDGPADRDMVIWRFLEDGRLDPGFGTDGIIVESGTAGGTGEDMARAITLDAEGRILVTGWSENASGILEMAIWRYE